jgi:hypothetical protein
VTLLKKWRIASLKWNAQPAFPSFLRKQPLKSTKSKGAFTGQLGGLSGSGEAMAHKPHIAEMILKRMEPTPALHQIRIWLARNVAIVNSLYW